MDIMLNKFYYDALDEVGNIGMGNATTALSQLVGKNIKISGSALALLGSDNAGGSMKRKMVGAVVKVVGDINGGFILMLNNNDADMLSDMLLPKSNCEDSIYMKTSAVIEVTNILAGAYYNALSKFLDITIIPSVPMITEGIPRELMDKCNQGLNGKFEHIFGLSTIFEIESGDELQSLSGDMYMLLDSTSLKVLLNKIENMRT